MFEVASGYPLLNAFWTMLVFFAWVIWIWLLFMVFADLFSRSDVSGWGKAGWTVFVLVLPYIGVLTYLIAEGRAMSDRREARARASQESFDAYVRSVAAAPGGEAAAAEISRAKELRDSGAISADEYETLKRKALAG